MTLITKGGESYAAKIPESRYSEFLKAPSQGSYFNLYIKPFATVTKVDIPGDVAMVESAKEKVAKYRDAVVAATTKPTRCSPAKSMLPKDPYKLGTTAWLDFRCIADPTTDTKLVEALKVFLAGKLGSKNARQNLPVGDYRDDVFRMWTEHTETVSGKVASKYVFDGDNVPMFHCGKGVGPRGALAAAYRSAYRSWLRRQKAKITPAMAVEAIGKEVFADGWGSDAKEPVSSRQTARTKKALENLDALENGQFYVTIDVTGKTQVHLVRGSMTFAIYPSHR